MRGLKRRHHLSDRKKSRQKNDSKTSWKEGLSEKNFTLREAKTRKGKKILDARRSGGDVNEKTKTSMIIRFKKTSQLLKNLLLDIHHIRCPYSTLLTKGNQESSVTLGNNFFEDIESLCVRHDSAFFLIGSSTKKNPLKLNLGRIYNSKILDMFTFTVSNYIPTSYFYEKNKDSRAFIPLDCKPIVICQGCEFNLSETYNSVRNVLCDFFSIHKMNTVNPYEGLRHVIVVSIVNNEAYRSIMKDSLMSQNDDNEKTKNILSETEKADSVPKQKNTSIPVLLFRRFAIIFGGNEKKNSSKAELYEIGPSFDMQLIEAKIADKSTMKCATRIPDEVYKLGTSVKSKKIKTDVFGETFSHIHTIKQDTRSIHTPHYHEYSKVKLN